MVPIRRALISVSDKTGIVGFARGLAALGVEILSTGGTAGLLREHAVSVKDVAGYTKFPEMLDGRVKTLHPAVHAGLLALRGNPAHMETIRTHRIDLIDMAVVNLYPFEATVRKKGVAPEEIIGNIDIGGPSLLRSAAKNHQSVAVICDPARYRRVLDELRANNGALPETFLRELAVEAFAATSRYDAMIRRYLGQLYAHDAPDAFPVRITLQLEKIQDLRYGENPHQKAAFYRESGAPAGIVGFKQLHGKELSFNNILDMNAAFELVREFSGSAAAIVKHNNPCGAAQAPTLARAFTSAWKCDTLSAFGGIVALNTRVDAETAARISKSGFLECIIAPGFSREAREILGLKKNVRVIACPHVGPDADIDFKRVGGGFLAQDKDTAALDEGALIIPTIKKPTVTQMESLMFAWRTAKHVKSNAIVLARGTATVGIGAGQMSRVDSVFIAVRKAGKRSRNACCASDAFFPKCDSIYQAAKAGITAIIQPGGSIADEEIISACNTHKIAMVLTGMRHFKH